MTMVSHVFEVPVPPSVNELFDPAIVNGKLTLKRSPWYNRYEANIAPMLPAGCRGKYDHKKHLPWSFTLWANIDHHQDLSNLLKALEDIAAKYLGLDDAYNNDIMLKRSPFFPDGRELPKGWCVGVVVLNDELGEEKGGKLHKLKGPADHGRHGSRDPEGDDSGKPGQEQDAALFAESGPRVVQGGRGGRKPVGRPRGTTRRRSGKA
jgi:hypothetical protein